MLLLLVLLVMVLMSLEILVLLVFWVFGSGVDTGFFPDGRAGVVCFGGGEVVPVSLCFGDPSSFWSPRSSPPGCLFWAGPDPGLHLHLLADGGGGCCVCCCGCCLFTAFGFLGAKLGDMADLFTPPAPWASSLYHHHHLPVSAY